MRRFALLFIMILLLSPLYAMQLDSSITLSGGITGSHFQSAAPQARTHYTLNADIYPLSMETSSLRFGPHLRAGYLSRSLSYAGQYYYSLISGGAGLFIGYTSTTIEGELSAGLSWGGNLSTGYKTMLLDTALTLKLFPDNTLIPFIRSSLSVERGELYASFSAGAELRFAWRKDR